MSSRNEFVQYFKQQREWDRCFELLRKKWESLGRTSGKIVLKNSTGEEKTAVRKLMAGKYRVNTEGDVEIFLAEFEKELQNTRFVPITLHELLEEYFDCEIKTNEEKRQEKKKQREKFFESCREYFRAGGKAESCRIVDWISCLEEHQEKGYALLMRELQEGEEAAGKMLCMIGNALEKVMQNTEDVPLAVLAAEVSENPHYLDRGHASGNLFMQGLCFLQNKAWPASSMEWKERLLEAHILPDDISSMVTVLGVHIQLADGMHPAVEAFCRMREPAVLTAVNLKRAAAAWTERGTAYVVENEMVFSYLADKLRDDNIALLCTSGQLRTAAIELLQLLVNSNTEIYYSGDMDPEGMGIADRLWKRYPEKIHLWRMSAEDYKRALSREELDKRSLSMLDSLCNTELQNTAGCIRKKKLAAYQENILTELLTDIFQSRQ